MKLYSIVFVALLASGCASTIESTIDTADNVELNAYETYAWLSDAPYVSDDTPRSKLINPLNYQRVRSGIDVELQHKGYRQVPLAEADLVLGVTLGERDSVRVRRYYNDYGYRYYGYNRFSRFNRFGRFGGFRRSFAPFVTTDVQKITKGTVSIDVFDTQSREAIWQGHATKSLTGDAMGRQLITDAVDALIGPIPARSAAVATTLDSTKTAAGAF